MPTSQEIQALQGTRLSERAPWESYSEEMGVQMTPELAAQVAEYAQKRYEDAPVGSETKEVLAQLHEENVALSKEYQWLSPEEYADEDARIGRLLSFVDLITMLRKAGVKCFYRQHIHPDKAVLWVINNRSEEALAAWVQISGLMPEYEFVNFDDKGVVTTTKRRGWRTVLLQMILKGMITEDTVNEHFGRATGPASHRYNSMLYEWRNRRLEVV
jgi:hypothetical protein